MSDFKVTKVGHIDRYYVRADPSFYIHVDYEGNEVTHFVIERLDRFGTRIKLTVAEVRAIAELAEKLGVVKRA